MSIAIHIIAMLMLGARTHFEGGAKFQANGKPEGTISIALISAPARLRSKPESSPDHSWQQSGNHKTSALPASTASNASVRHLPAFHPAGKLTRLPEPLADVDLNVSPINSLPAVGRIELTLLVDEHGNVADVIPKSTTVQGKALAELVAAQFRAVRFSPGEIRGKKVNSRVTLVVISDPAKPLGSAAA